MPEAIIPGKPFPLKVNDKIYAGFLGEGRVLVTYEKPGSLQLGGNDYLQVQQEGIFEYQAAEKTYICKESTNMNEQLQNAIIAKLRELIPKLPASKT